MLNGLCGYPSANQSLTRASRIAYVVPGSGWQSEMQNLFNVLNNTVIG